MTKEAIEGEIIGVYPVYIGKLQSIENELVKSLKWYLNNQPDLLKGEDFRPGTLSRFLSCSMTVRFSLNRIIDYVKQKDWDKDFLTNYAPEPVHASGYLGHIKDIDLMSRFYLFHSFYHQLETTIRIVHAELKIGNGKPMEKVNNQLNVFPKEFILCVDALRNTIHNNGYYRPFDFQPETIEYKTGPVTISMKKDDRLDIGTDETLFIIRDLINYTEKLLKHEKIVALPLVKDRN